MVHCAEWVEAYSSSTKRRYFWNAARKLSLYVDETLPEGWLFGRYGSVARSVCAPV